MKTSITSTPPSPPEAWKPLHRALRRAVGPLERFLHIEAASGIVLLLSSAIALVWANSPWAESYRAFWHSAVGLRVGAFAFERSLEWVVNDGLMVIFFFVVGLEIRREIHMGELSEWRRATLPVFAALGGVAVPALLYLLFSTGGDTQRGWAVPTATDIAFAIGVMTLLGRRAPPALRVLLLALAVIDDLAAIIVIAAFYSAGLAPFGLGVAALGLTAVVVMRGAGIRTKALYIAPGLVVWGGIYAAGVHPTIAGVVLGLVTPVRAWLGPEGFVRTAPRRFEEFSRLVEDRPADSHALNAALQSFTAARREALSPAERLIALLHPWVAFGIMPIFALANAGVSLSGLSIEGSAGAVALAVVLGLVVGKPVGILLFSALALRAGVARLPSGLSGRHLLVLGVIAGIGFTMALFIAQLAFHEPALLAAAKLGVLAATAIAAVVGLALGMLLLRPPRPTDSVAETADEAEQSTSH